MFFNKFFTYFIIFFPFFRDDAFGSGFGTKFDSVGSMPLAASATTSGFDSNGFDASGFETAGFENSGFGAPEFVENHITQSAHKEQHTHTPTNVSISKNDSSTPLTTAGFDNFGFDAFGRYVVTI